MLVNSMRPGHYRTFHFGGVLATIAAVCLLVVAFEGWHIWESRSIIIAAEQVETENLAQSLAQHAHDLIQAVDVVLRGVRERTETDGLAPHGLERLHRWMKTTIETIPMIQGVFVYDAAGNWLANSASLARSPLNNSDRDYFQYHHDHHEDHIFFGKPVTSKSDGNWIVTVSRRIDDASGAFAGVVLVTISIDTLRQFYATFNMGKSGAITLLSSDGIVLAREPSDTVPVGMDLSRSEVFQNFLPRSPAGSLTAVYAVDGLTRLGSYRCVDGYPLVIVIAHGLDEVLREWRSDARLHLGITILTVLALAILGIRFVNQLRTSQRADRRYRLLADNSSDVIACIGLDGRRLYLSPSMLPMTGWSVRDGLSRPWQDFIHPDDRPTILTIAARVHAGFEPTIAISLRYTCKSGLYRWAEARVQRVDAGDGAEVQFVTNIRDITEHKLAEDQIAALNEELAVQAVTDGLTGLANRRRFDQALEQEWRRAARERKSLSLMMIDVDHFKLYNDCYGHQQGDQCLRNVATTIAGWARRGGDIAARYGGEEFVILLPGAVMADAARLAEGLRAAIQALSLVHAGNLPGGVVTASIGLATMTPVPDAEASQPEDLVAAADAALYQAKHAGRNTVVAHTPVAVAVIPMPAS